MAATNVTIHQLLATSTVTRAISRIKTPQSRFQEFFGMQPGGANNNPVGGRMVGWDIFDRTRTIAKGRAPGTGPGTIAANPIGHISARVYRAHEKLTLLEERIMRTRPLGGQWGQVDARGMSYVTSQQSYMAQRFKNSREFMVSRMLRGGFSLLVSGDDITPVDLGTAGSLFDVDYQIPAANKLQFTDQMGTVSGGGNLIDVPWDDPGADIFAHCVKINAAFEQLHGRPLRHVWLNSTLFTSVAGNTSLQDKAGTANAIMATFAPSGYKNADGIEDPGLTVVFRALPWLTWHVYDAGLDVNGTYTKFLPDANASFLPEPSNDWAEWLNGSEVVAENVLDGGTERYGLHAWTTRVIDPAGFELKSVDNGIPAPYVPKCITWGTVTGF